MQSPREWLMDRIAEWQAKSKEASNNADLPTGGVISFTPWPRQQKNGRNPLTTRIPAILLTKKN